MTQPATPLSPQDHDRNRAGMTYVYPVLSRRAGGLSVGINLNPNNACNWRCIYCQVPGLTRGAPPAIDLELLESELRRQLEQVVHGDFLQRELPEGFRRLADTAFSGNGEPTSAREFPQAVALVGQVLREFGLADSVKVRLITNGSLVERPHVLAAIGELSRCNGEVWFKLDAATPDAIARINDVQLDPRTVLERLRHCARACPTWVQTCMFALDDTPPAEPELAAYLDLLAQVAGEIAGVHLYGLARPSLQPEAPRLARLPATWLEDCAERIRQRGLIVQVSP